MDVVLPPTEYINLNNITELFVPTCNGEYRYNESTIYHYWVFLLCLLMLSTCLWINICFCLFFCSKYWRTLLGHLWNIIYGYFRGEFIPCWYTAGVNCSARIHQLWKCHSRWPWTPSQFHLAALYILPSILVEFCRLLTSKFTGG